MNRFTRMLMITGLGVVTGLAIGAGPAMAATHTGPAATKSATTVTLAKPGHRVAGYYDSRDECRLAGQIGDRLGRWDDWDCYPVLSSGWHDGDWVLVVDEDWDGGFPFHLGVFPFHHGPLHHGPFHPDSIRPHRGGTTHNSNNNVGMPTAKPAKS